VAPLVSIVVPTFNRRERLQRLLLALEQLVSSSPAFEVVVAVDGATDGSVEMLNSLHTTYPLRVFEQANQGPAAARNLGIANALGQIILFLDDDVIPVAGLIERHVRRHEQDEKVVVIGPMVPPPDLEMTPWVRWESERLDQQYLAMQAGEWAPTARQFYTGNASLRREHALATGGFNERFKRAEDVEFAYRLADRGLSFHFDMQAAVLHDPGRPFAAWLRVPYEYGRYDVLMARESGRQWLLKVALHEWQNRHPLNRLLPRLCVGHKWRMRSVVAVLGFAVRLPLPAIFSRLQIAPCSPLFGIQYWQGISDMAGLGANPWRGLRRAKNNPTRHAVADELGVA
jgi:GT2 family glycosyltransferase